MNCETDTLLTQKKKKRLKREIYALKMPKAIFREEKN